MHGGDLFVGQSVGRPRPATLERGPTSLTDPERHAMAEDLDIRIGRNLREMRLKARLDVDALAVRAGLPMAVLARYEEGRLRVPVEVLARLAELLHRPLGDFFA